VDKYGEEKGLVEEIELKYLSEVFLKFVLFRCLIALTFVINRSITRRETMPN